MSAKAAGRRQPGGLRSALQQAQQAADLAEAALRLPPLGRSKPLFYITQLQPVLLALSEAAQLHEGGASSGHSGDSQAAAERPVCEAAGQAGLHSAPSVAAAARHLRRLAAVDGQRAANECLLFWLMAVMAQQALRDSSQAAAAEAGARAAYIAPGSGAASEDTAVWRRSSLLPGDFLLLVHAMGWGELLVACLEQAPGLAQRLLRHCSDTPCHATSLRPVLIADVAAQAARLLGAAGRQALAEQPGLTGGPTAAGGAAGLDAVAAELAHDLELLQQELLAWQSSTAGAAAGGQAQACPLTTALQRLAAAADGSMRVLLPLAQQPSWQPSHQHLFQQLCQLRARLAMLLAPAAVAAAAAAAQGPSGRGPDDSSASSSSGPRLAAPELSGWQLGSAPAGAAWQAWQAVLKLGQPLGAAGHQAAVGSTAPSVQQQAGSGSTLGSSEIGAPTCTTPAFLAARVTARALLEQAAPAGGEAVGQGAGAAAAPATGSHGAAGPQPPASGSAPQLAPEFAGCVPALPGVKFPPPAPSQAALARLPEAARRRGGGSGDTLPAFALLGSNPDPLSPAKLTLAALDLAQQYLNQSAGLHNNTPAGQLPPEHSSRDASGASSGAVVHALLWLGQAAAARVEGRQEQRALLECALQGERFAALRRAAERDAALQEWCRKELLALSNRLADSGGAVKVFGDERQRVATLVREVAPFGLLAPAAAVERLVTDALSHAGQAGPIAEALAEMGPLAGYSHPASPASTHLADCLYACLASPAAQPPSPPAGAAVPRPFAPPPTLLDSPAGSQAFLGLARQLCAPRAAAGGRSLVDPSAVLRRAVLPLLQSLAQPKAQQGQQGAATGAPAHATLALALQLACALLGSGSGQPPTVPVEPAMGPDAEVTAAASLVLDTGAEVAEDAPSSSSSSSSGGGGGGGGGGRASLAEQLLLPLLRLLDFSSRQLSASAAALLMPLDCYELASALAQRVVQLLAWAVAAAAPFSAAAGGVGGGGGLVEVARQAATALCSPAPGLLSKLPDAWLHLQPLQAAVSLHGDGDAASQLVGVPAAAAQQPPGSGAAAAAQLLQLCAAQPPSANWAAEQVLLVVPSAGSGSAAAYAQPLLLSLQQLPLPEARQALAAACAATLPVCTPAEAARVLEAGLPLAVLSVVGPPGAALQRGQQQEAQRAALQAAALEVACRGVHALALQPRACPITGEVMAAGSACEEEQGDGQHSRGPSALRQVAVERALRHLSAHCRTLTSAAGAAAAGSGGRVAGALAAERQQAESTAAPAAGQEAAGVAAGLAVRCFLEVSRLAAALRPFYSCTTLQVCLLHLVQVLRDQGGGSLPAETADALRSSAARLEGGLGETVRFALEEAEESNL